MLMAFSGPREKSIFSPHDTRELLPRHGLGIQNILVGGKRKRRRKRPLLIIRGGGGEQYAPNLISLTALHTSLDGSNSIVTKVGICWMLRQGREEAGIKELCLSKLKQDLWGLWQCRLSLAWGSLLLKARLPIHKTEVSSVWSLISKSNGTESTGGLPFTQSLPNSQKTGSYTPQVMAARQALCTYLACIQWKINWKNYQELLSGINVGIKPTPLSWR